ncbi:methyltransferase domain-containing protein [Cylindrospermopsis raciborskii UAM/DH-MRr]|uniref:methyltransferase domain-containing protein n=1 Tax=Cylindrospermopsis raciborskii TaxID=77022 RepID=UPI00387A0D6B
MRQVIRDKDLNHLLLKRGYIQQPLLLDSEVSYLLEETQKAYPESRFSPDKANISQSYVANSYTDQSEEVRAIGPKIIQNILSPHIEDLLDDYRILYCGLFVKAPRGGWLDIHYHPTVVEDLKHWIIDIWCPLLDTDLSNGTLCVVPESHKIFPEVIDYPSETALFCRDYKRNIREKYSIALPSKAGHGVIFEDSLLHWSPQNLTNSARYAVHCTCIPREAIAVHIHFDSRSPQQFEIYEGTDKFFEEEFGRPVPRPGDLKLLKIIPNQNRPYGFEEFQERMGNAAQLRQELYPDSYYVSPVEFANLLQKEQEMYREVHYPIPISEELAAEPILMDAATRLLNGPPQEVQPQTAKIPPLLSRITATVKRLLRAQSRSTRNISQPSEVVRDVRSPVNQHTVADVKRYYEKWTRSYIEGFGEVFQGSRPTSTDELLEYLIQSARLEDGIRVLDAGCGVCGPAIRFAEQFNLNIEALTLAQVQVEESQKRIKAKGLEHQINVRQGDFHHLAQLYPANSFDRVLFLESLCHAEDYRRALEQAKKVLKPGGFLYIKDFYAVDHRSCPELLELHAKDLRELNRIYCLVMPDLPGMVDIISELGFDIYYMRKPMYAYSPAAWKNFMRHTNTFWARESGKAIEDIEFLAYKPLN